MVPRALQLRCPAKVNLALSVGAPDATGYHPIASWMAATEFCDTLHLQPAADEADAGLAIAFADDAPAPRPVDWPIERDLAWRAWKLIEQAVGRPVPVAADLRKRIPPGAGLAGGSSDAAAMLVGLDRLMDLNLGRAALHHLAGELGSDIPFLVDVLLGQPAAIVTGRGERIEPVPTARPIPLVIVLPPLHCATGEVYRTFDDTTPAGRSPDTGRVRRLVSRSPLPADAPFNDLADPACRVEPRLAELREQVAAAADRPAHVSGSGASLFLVADSDPHARDLADTVRARTGLPVVVTRTLA